MSLRRLRWVTVIAPITFLGIVDLVRHLVYPELLHAWPGYVLIGGLVLLASLAFSDLIFNRFARMQERLASQNRALRDLQAQVRDLAIAEERNRLAREMHDSLAQVLGYVNTKTEAILELQRAGRADQVEKQITQLGEAARSAYVDVREGILGLRTTLGPDHTLLDALRDYVAQWETGSGVAAELIARDDAKRLTGLSQSAELQLLRIVQESLTNVRKHAGATRAVVTLTTDQNGITVVVCDDGHGFDPSQLSEAAFPRFGLSAMRERAEAIGATLTIDSTVTQGTRVQVHLPASSTGSPDGVPAAYARAHS